MSDNSKSMQLVVSQKDLQCLYSSEPKVIIAASDKDIFSETLDIARDFNIYQYKFEQLSNQGVISLLEGGQNSNLNNLNHNLNTDLKFIEMPLAPNFCLGLLVFTDMGKAELGRLINWWTANGNNYSIPNFIELDQQQEAAKIQSEFWHQAYQIQERETTAIAQRIASLQKQYLGLRTLHENMQNAFATVEEYLSLAKLPTLQLAFENQPDQKQVEPGNAQSKKLSVKQLLPVSSRGIGIIELFITSNDSDAQGNLVVKLKICEDNTHFALWQITYDQLSPGWLSLDLPSIDVGRKRDVELIVEWNTYSSVGPCIALGKIQPIPELRAYGNETSMPCSLAFRVWQGLPGTRRVTSPHLEHNNQPREIKLGYLGQGIMAGVQEVTANPEESFAHVQVIDHGAKIMTHPRIDGNATIAILPFSFSSQANYLIATVITEHEKAEVMEYALAVISPDTKLDYLDCLDYLPKNTLEGKSTLAYSGWIKVEPNIPRQISVFLEHLPSENCPENCHIVIAARLAPDSKPDCAWCRWLNFKLDWRSQAPDNNDQRSAVEPIRNASLDAQTESFPRVQMLKTPGKIQVHPLMGVDTVAVLSRAVPHYTTMVKAIVCTSNEKASVIEYAIAVIDHDDDAQARLAIASDNLVLDKSALGFSGWHRVKANTPYRLNLELAQVTKTDCHLVLATRIPEEGSQAHAWARWLDIRYISVGEKAHSQERHSPA